MKLGLGCHEAAKWFVVLIIQPPCVNFILIYENQTKVVSEVVATATAMAVVKCVAMGILCFIA